MKALVTTSFSVLALDAGARRVQPVHRGAGLYYGLARHEGALLAAGRGRLLSEGDGPVADQGRLIAFRGRPARAETITPDIPLRDLHGIAGVGGALWCLCSYDNAVAILKDGHFRLVHPLGRPDERPFDVNHLNTVHVRDGRVLLLAHNWGESEVIEVEPATLKILSRRRIGMLAHNIWFDEGVLRVCSSGEGRIVGEDGFSLEVGHFPRGYAEDADVRLVGLNTHAPRALRDATDSRILMLDRDYRRLGEIALGGEGMILDILALSDDEHAALIAGALEFEARDC